MLSSSTSALSLQQQQMRQYAASSSSSCDYVVHVPTSFMVSKEQLEEFYKSNQKFKQTSTFNVKDAAVSVFMNQPMFEEFVKFVKKTEHARELLLIAKSYTNATTQHKTMLDDMPYVWDASLNPMTKATATLDERFRYIYTDSQNINLLKYFYTYMRDLYKIKIGTGTGAYYSVGRIQSYVPALNSNMKQTPAPHVDCTDVDANTGSTPPTPAIYLKPSYNVEIMDKFWSGIITGQGLPNRAPLSRPDKIKVIQDNTRLYTFRSTPEYSMNYDALLERLYYKYPCYLNGVASVNNMYNNDVLMRLMKYSNNANSHAVSPLLKADYLKKLYANPSGDEVLYAICGPVYFDYTWIFKQHPELIRHILGEDTDPADKTSRWEERIDPLTENRHYVNRNPPNPNYPKTRFDVNPDTSPLPADCKEEYVSPSVAKSDIDNVGANITAADAFTAAVVAAPGTAWAIQWNTDNQAANAIAANAVTATDLPIIYDWTTPGYYQYEITSTVENQTKLGQIAQLTYRFTQLMRPPPQPNIVQDYTEPNLPTAYPPPLMFVVPEMRGPANSFMIHACLPDLSSNNSPSYEKFMSGSRLNGDAYEKHMYNMMQLIFESAIKNAKANGAMSAAQPNYTNYNGSRPASNKICIKIMAVGYGDTNRNLKAITKDDDKTFIGNAFFNAVRDYSMLYETNNVHVAVYYDAINQSVIRQRYDEYTRRRESVLLRSRSQAFDSDLKLTIQPMENFFTLRFPFTTTRRQLKKNDLLYFVDYCSSPRAFIGNCGEVPDNIQEVISEVSSPTAGAATLNKCLDAAYKEIQKLYVQRKIVDKITNISENLENWNTTPPLQPNTMIGPYTALKTNYLAYNTDDAVFNALDTHKHTNVNVSWWQGVNNVSNNSLPRNAYMSSFDEHVMILNNLLDSGRTAFSITASPPPYAPLMAENRFEYAVYAYTQAKKILTLLSKMGSDEIQITAADQIIVKAALDELNKFPIQFSWSLDAKLTAAVAEGAFIPNSSVLHNPFMCTKLLDPKEWQFIDYEEISVHSVAGTYPLPPQLKQLVESKISSGSGSGAGLKTVTISKQPKINTLTQNIKIILENLFYEDPRVGKTRIDKQVLNDYVWPDNRVYSQNKRNTDIRLMGDAIDFAKLSGVKQPSSGCIHFPLFIINLMLYLIEGNASDMSLNDTLKNACDAESGRLKNNALLVWDQMAENMKAKISKGGSRSACVSKNGSRNKSRRRSKSNR